MAVLSGPYVSIASGAGGLDLAVAAATGGRAFTVLYVERELTCAAVLASRMEDGSLPPAPVWSDLRLLDARLLRDKVAGVVAGFPCQPYSVAGKQLGELDERDLWPECLRVVVEAGPDWCYFENVGGSLRDYVGRFEPDLRGAGYRTAAGLFTAAEVGAPHGRERLFFLAVADAASRGRRQPHHVDGASNGVDRRGESVLEAPAGGEHGARRGAAARAGTAVADSDATGRSLKRIAIPEDGHAQSGCDANGRDADVGAADGARLQGRRGPIGERGDELPAWPPGPEGDWTGIPERLWPATAQPAVRRVADGLPGGLALSRADQLRILGNSVVHQQAEHAMRTLMRTLGGAL